MFLSRPNTLNADQDESLKIILGELDRLRLEARTVGQTDYPTDFPLREVHTLARHCSGGVILGFSQFEASSGVWKRATPFEKRVKNKSVVAFPTPWNQIEAGILFALGLPLIVFKENGIDGGIFDHGVTDLFVHPMPRIGSDAKALGSLREVFGKWNALVHNSYYSISTLPRR